MLDQLGAAMASRTPLALPFELRIDTKVRFVAEESSRTLSNVLTKLYYVEF